MQLLRNEPDIQLYEQGFENNDLLGRAETGKQLSNLVENLSQPTVIAVEAGWGMGKTHFLKSWAGAHSLENDGKALTIYFDAFAHDYADEPLMSLMATLEKRAGNASIEDAQNKAKNLGKLAGRIGFGAVKGAVKTIPIAGEMIDGAVDGAVDAIGDDGSAIDPYELAKSRQKALNTFKKDLEEIAAEQKLVFIVDELDRCRPDYALAVLDLIKHIFSVPNVHFVLGVNAEQLGGLVANRYGEVADGQKYLGKFVDIILKLQTSYVGNDGKSASVHKRYALSLLPSEYQSDDNIVAQTIFFARRALKWESVPLRDANKVINNLVMLAMVSEESPHNTKVWPFQRLLISLAFLKIVAPHAFIDAYDGSLKIKDLHPYFNLSAMLSDDYEKQYENDTYIVLAGYFEPELLSDDQKTEHANYWRFSQAPWLPHNKPIISQIIDEHLERFTFTE